MYKFFRNDPYSLEVMSKMFTIKGVTHKSSPVNRAIAIEVSPPK